MYPGFLQAVLREGYPVSTSVIFLDVDGVLNSRTFAKRMREREGVNVFRHDILDEGALLLLKEIIDRTGAKIVVSSSWRKIPSKLLALKDWLAYYGMEVYDVTPYAGGERGNDITAWLKRHPSVHKYAILDDDSDMGAHIVHLAQTSFAGCGLTRKVANKAIDILTRPTKDSKPEPIHSTE